VGDRLSSVPLVMSACRDLPLLRWLDTGLS